MAAVTVTFTFSPTAETNGDVSFFVLPGNLIIQLTTHAVRHPDGRQLQRVGMRPHLHVEPTIAGVREGRDEVLEAAVRFLRGCA